MRNFKWTVVLGMVVAGAGLVAGCALFQPSALPEPTSIANVSNTSAQAQAAATLTEATELLTQLKTAAATNSPPVAITPLTLATPATPAPEPAVMPAVTPVAPVIPAINAPTTSPASGPTLEKQAQVLTLLTTAMQQLNNDLQNAPTAQAQQQAAFNAGVQTAQSAAVTFGGPYGTLIAAGIGIVSVLVQGLFNTGKAHQAAQAASATAQTLAGKLPSAVH